MDLDNDAPRQRAKRKLLRVTFGDGRPFCYSNATTTMLMALRHIGVERLKNITLESNHFPVISQTEHPKYRDNQKIIEPGWYYYAFSDSETKYHQLMSIKLQLGLEDMKIEIGSDFVPDAAKRFQKRSKRDTCLLVKFPDGEYVGGRNPIDTYTETIKKIGIDSLRRKNLELSEKDLLTSVKRYYGQVEIEPNCWLTVPNGTKDKCKWLKVIGLHMRINLDVTMI